MNVEEIGPLESQASLDLLGRMQRGDSRARDALIQRYRPRLERWAHGRLPMGARDLHDTTDLVQETLIAALKRLDEFTPRHDGALQAYFRVALMNRIRSLARRARRHGGRATMESGLPDRGPSPLEEAIGRETMENYERALQRLRPEDRDAIFLKIELDLPYHEVMTQLGKPSAVAARKAVSRALYRLALEMRRHARA